MAAAACLASHRRFFYFLFIAFCWRLELDLSVFLISNSSTHDSRVELIFFKFRLVPAFIESIYLMTDERWPGRLALCYRQASFASAFQSIISDFSLTIGFFYCKELNFHFKHLIISLQVLNSEFSLKIWILNPTSLIECSNNSCMLVQLTSGWF